MTIKVVGKPVNLPQRFGLLHHIKKIAIIPVFWFSPLILCLFVLSLNYINKKCDNYPSGSIQSTYSCKWMNGSITNSEINSLGTLNSKFPTFSHAQLTLESTSDKQGGCKTGGFNAVVRPTSQWKSNFKKPGILMLVSYLCLIFLFFWYDSIWCIKLFWVWG